MTSDDMPRPLSDIERGVIAHLLAVPFPGRDELRAQLPFAAVRPSTLLWTTLQRRPRCCPVRRYRLTSVTASSTPASFYSSMVRAICPAWRPIPSGVAVRRHPRLKVTAGIAAGTLSPVHRCRHSGELPCGLVRQAMLSLAAFA